MRTLLGCCVLLATVSPGVVASQAAPGGGPAVATMRQLWTQVTGYITAAAEDMPEAEYAFKPTAGVRSFGELIGHVAGAQNLFCAAALGDPPRDEGEIERTRTTKTALVAALKESTAYCTRAYALSDSASQGRTQLFGQSQSRLFALGQNALHNGEHYGNLVTYLRIKGMVPPSSRPRQ